MFMRVVSSSEIAKLIARPAEGDETSLKFGKIFEECYTFATYLHDKFVFQVNRKFARKVAVMLRLNGIYSKDLVERAYRMYSTLLKAGVVGSKPRTEFKRYNEILISAQPDLFDWETSKYYEFKTYPIDDYARAQCKVFSWVLGEPIILVGLKTREDGYVEFEKEEISAEGFRIPNIPENLGEMQEVCENCWRPIDSCVCAGEHEYEEYDEDFE